MAFEIIEGETAQQTFDRFLAGQKEASYTLGDYSGTAEGDMQLYTELKIAVEKEAKKVADFNLAKEAAFQELAVKHDAERQELGTLWQEKENAGYDVEYIPTTE